MTDNARQKALEALLRIERGHNHWGGNLSGKSLDRLDFETIRAALQIDLDAIIQEIKGLKEEYDHEKEAVSKNDYLEAGKCIGANEMANKIISIIRKHEIKECEETKGGA